MIPVVKKLDKGKARPLCWSDLTDPTNRGRGACGVQATVTVDDKPMCRRHAGGYLIDLLANQPAENQGDCQ